MSVIFSLFFSDPAGMRRSCDVENMLKLHCDVYDVFTMSLQRYLKDINFMFLKDVMLTFR